MFRAVVLADGDELTVAEFPQIAEPRNPNVMRLIDDSGDVRKIDDIEAEAIRFAFAHYRGQMSQMARKLGIGRSTLYRKMKELGVDTDVLGEAAA